MAYTHTVIEIIPSVLCTGGSSFDVSETRYAGTLPLSRQFISRGLSAPVAADLADTLQQQCDDHDKASRP
ncbi:MAG: hypothetical protein M3Y56_09640 [Armatimonadota bacterium]|nr:hypothetical protein [Armatimonadota bacterium]